MSVIGVTTAPMDRIVQRVRSLIEPMYGPMKSVRRELPNGNTKHLLLAPRYDVSNFHQDFRWLEVNINFDPGTQRSVIEFQRVSRNWRLMRFSAHGGLLPFPTVMQSRGKGAEEFELLRTLMESLEDPSFRITSWGKLDDDDASR